MSRARRPLDHDLPVVDPVNYEIDDEAAERIDRNLELTSRFLQAVIDDPAIADDIPDNAYLFFVPEDDPELAKANLQGAEDMAQAGHLVRIIHERSWKL